jgi:hypothetical protein
VREWVPDVKVVNASVADPPESGAVPSTVAPSLNVTLPVTVPVPGGTAVTVDESVTLWPNTEGLGEAVNVVFVVIAFTTCVTMLEVLAVKLASPP